MPVLTSKETSHSLTSVPDWTKRAKTIRRTFRFEGFVSGTALVGRIAKRAQRLNHHPDIDIRFGQVTLTLTTHDEGGLTENDFTLARDWDEVFSRHSES